VRENDNSSETEMNMKRMKQVYEIINRGNMKYIHENEEWRRK